MIITRTKKEFDRYYKLIKESKKTVGFVPTMGALHEGHLSLIKCSNKDNNFTVVSIFVNPAQFNNSEDLKNYPRNEERDFDLLLKASCDIVFVPDVNEMYPETDNRVFEFNGLDRLMEGKYRKGHFNGVAQIVSKLFQIIKPDNAYFGRKDFQQAAIIKSMNKNYLKDLNIKIVTCDIIREKDGLAMSSRNQLLNESERKSAVRIYQTINKYVKQYSKYSVRELIEKITNEINQDSNLKVEYIDIVDDKNLQTVNEIVPGKTTFCAAVYDGKIRLIDNFAVK
ncbi:MAG: pantoate--beta-alanine ligase [Bacteroidales bacterium]|nr:pantoate--beta-alanine ligase [Bacteroidales bacterium]